ncbi:MAG: redox-sensing transcriptional repressor Rex [Pseudonocardiaceae bacterium]
MQQHGRYGGDGAARPAAAPVSADPADPAVRAQVRTLPEAAVARLAAYLQVLTSLIEQGVTTISSEELAGIAGVNSAKLRKDLSYVGSYGTRGVGYDTARLVEHIERLLGLTRQHSVAVVGIGNLGHALANYGGFPSRGFPVTALFDIDDDLIGIAVGGLPVNHINSIPAVCAQRTVTIGVICTPPAAAQTVCDLLVVGGVRCILNFAPVVLQVPEDVEVRKVDLAVEMQILSFHEARRRRDDEVIAAVEPAAVEPAAVESVVAPVVEPGVDELVEPLADPVEGIAVGR